MNLFSFLKKKKSDSQHFLVLDIGSNNIRALIVKVDENNNKGYIVGYGKETLPFNNVKHRQILNINSVVEACDTAIAGAVNLSGINPQNVIAGISGPEIISEINVAGHTRSHPEQKINHAELQKIFQQIQIKSKNELFEKKSKHESDDRIELVNAAIIQVMVDNTPVENPINFTGKNLEITYYHSYAPLFQIGALQSVIDELRLNLVSIINEPYALCKSFDLKQYHYRDCIFVDIGGDTTNIACVQDGQIAFTTCFNMGCRSFVNKLAKEIDVSEEKSDQYLKDYCDDLLADETASEFNLIFTDIAGKWKKELTKTLSSQEIEEFPRKIFICGGGSQIPEIKNTLEQQWSSGINFMGKPILKNIHPVDIENVIDKTSMIKGSQDINAISLANIGLKFNNIDGTADKFIKRVMQTIRT